MHSSAICSFHASHLTPYVLLQGLEFLQGVRLLPETLNSESVAFFFRMTPGLNKVGWIVFCMGCNPIGR
jgi:hypothetical protein